MVFGMRMEPERQSDRLAQPHGGTGRACIREAIRRLRLRQGDRVKAGGLSECRAQLEPPNRSGLVPDRSGLVPVWSDWTA